MNEFTEADIAILRRKLISINSSANKRGAYDRISAPDWINLLKRHGLRCHYCNEELNLKTLTADHVIPIAESGPNRIENVVPSCMYCNTHKQRKIPEGFTLPSYQPDSVKRLFRVGQDPERWGEIDARIDELRRLESEMKEGEKSYSTEAALAL